LVCRFRGNLEISGRRRDFRSTPANRHCESWAACRKGANNRHRATTCVRSAQPVRWKHIRPSMLRPQLRPCRCDEQRPSNRCPILSLRLTTYFRRLCPDRFRCCSNKYACQRRGAEILRQSCDHPFHSSTDSFLTMLTTFDRAISRCDGERAMSEGSLSRSYDPYVGPRSSPARFS